MMLGDEDFINLDEQIGGDTETTISPSPTRVPIRLSYSSRNLLRGCERKYYLTRYKVLDELSLPTRDTNETNVHLDFGSALGIGVQDLLATQDLQHAIWEAIRAYNFAFETDQKNILSLVYGLMSFHEQWEYDEWEFISGEASFKILLDPDTGDYVCGFMDAIIRNKSTGYYTVVEAKTTQSRLSDLTPMYKNSDQGVGYSVVLDSMVPDQATFHVLYIVLQLRYNDIRPLWHFMPFIKTKKHKLEYLLTQQMDYEYLRHLEEVDFWPMRGNHCLTYNRPCNLFGVCDLDSIQELPFMPAKEEHDWDFVFQIDDLIKEQMK